MDGKREREREREREVDEAARDAFSATGGINVAI